jgi:hypothetical protein
MIYNLSDVFHFDNKFTVVSYIESKFWFWLIVFTIVL